MEGPFLAGILGVIEASIGIAEPTRFVTTTRAPAPRPSYGLNGAMGIYANYLEPRLPVVRQLASDGFYPEATLLATAMLSGMSALLWPKDPKTGAAKGPDGKGAKKQPGDRTRFVELVVQLGKVEPLPATISIPLLHQHLLSEAGLAAKAGKDSSVLRGQTQALAQLRPGLLHGVDRSVIVTSEDIDLHEDKVRKALPSAGLKLVRRFSYASQLYALLRCGLSHEFKLVRGVTGFPMTSRDARISYASRSVGELAPRPSTWETDEQFAQRCPSMREIFFRIDWLEDLVRSCASATDNLLGQDAFDGEDSPGIPRPGVWWVDGG